MNTYALNDKSLRVTFYTRLVSDADTKSQIARYEELIRRNPRWSMAEGYIETVSEDDETTTRHAAFHQMLADAKRGGFDLVITEEISRFSRNTIESIRHTQELLSLGVNVFFLADGFHTLMPDAALRLKIMHDIAQEETQKLSKRVKTGLKRAVEKGKILGSGNIWGYKKENGRLTIDESQAPTVRLIFSLYAEKNLGMRSVCTHLKESGIKNSRGNDFSFSTIKGILTNPKYMGDENNAVPPLITPQLWQKANEILQERGAKKAETSYQNKYIYSGKIFCAQHDTPFHHAKFRYKSGDKEVWQCRNYAAKGTAGCDSPAVYTAELDKIMHQAYSYLAENRDETENNLAEIFDSIRSVATINEDIAATNTALEEIRLRKDKLLDLSISGYISNGEFAKRNREMNKEAEFWEQRGNELLNEAEKAKSLTRTMENLHSFISNKNASIGENLPALVNILPERIVVQKTQDKHILELQVFLKVLAKRIDFTITRKRQHPTEINITRVL